MNDDYSPDAPPWAEDEEITDLIASIEQADNEYYGEGEVTISDQEYDRRKARLRELLPDHPLVRKVGHSVTSSPLQKVKHRVPMGSLDNIFNLAEFEKWGPCHDLILEWKLDGISIELLYEDGIFRQAITRGDGFEGEDVTHTIREASGFPKEIPLWMVRGHEASIRCEAVLPIAEWKALFSDKANPRNAVAGIVRRKEVDGSSQHIRLVAYDLIAGPASGKRIKAGNEAEILHVLDCLGFETVEREVIPCTSSAEFVEETIQKWSQKRQDYKYLVDGVVLKVNSIAVQEEMGEKDLRPRWAKAWKFEPQGGHSKITNVKWQVGTTGVITPVAEIDPIQVCGVTISNVTLHNMSQIETLGIAIGDTIEVIRSGDVIPKVIRKVVDGENRKQIECTCCPSCGSPVERRGPRIYCTGDNCVASRFERLHKWVVERNIMHLGEGILEKLAEEAGVQFPHQLYHLPLVTLQNVAGGANGRKIWDEIDKSRECSLDEFFAALSIDMVGKKLAQKLITSCGLDTVEKWLEVKEFDLVCKGIGDITASRVVSSLQKQKDVIQKTAAQMRFKAVSRDGILKGKSFCFTGTMSRPRKELEALVVSLGGTVESQVKKTLTYLVSSETGTTKMQAAEKYGVNVITEEQFNELSRAS